MGSSGTQKCSVSFWKVALLLFLAADTYSIVQRKFRVTRNNIFICSIVILKKEIALIQIQMSSSK